MINDNIDKNEVESDNLDKDNILNDASVDVDTVSDSKEDELTDIAAKQTINYLDPSIINIKQYEYDELGEEDGLTNSVNDSSYDLGIDTKEKEVVQGQVVRVSDRDIFIDIGFKSEGIVPKNEFNSIPVVGEMVDVFIITFEDRKGN